jgi:CRP-like cAMP-binding protein
VSAGIMDGDYLILFLSQTELFRGLDGPALDTVARAARLRRIRDGAIFFHQDQPATTLYVLIEGRVKFTQVTADGQQVLLRVAGPGEMFGAVAALGDAFHPATAHAQGDCAALGWRSEVIASLMEQFPRIAVNALRFMAGRLTEFQERYRELATERVERRVARTLFRLSRQMGRESDSGVLIDLPLTRQEIAEMAGTTLFTVSRVLSAWQQGGLVKTHKERIAILDVVALRAKAEGSLSD